MSCCCTNILRLCDVEACTGTIAFQIKAQANGIHKMELEFLGSLLTIEKTFAINDDIEFSAEGLNENFEYLVRLYQPDGGQISISKDAVTYDCFSFKTLHSTAIIQA